MVHLARSPEGDRRVVGGGRGRRCARRGRGAGGVAPLTGGRTRRPGRPRRSGWRARRRWPRARPWSRARPWDAGWPRRVRAAAARRARGIRADRARAPPARGARNRGAAGRRGCWWSALLGAALLALGGPGGRRLDLGRAPGPLPAGGRGRAAPDRRSRWRTPWPAGGRPAGRWSPPRASVEGPPAAELARIRADLELGASTAEALSAPSGSPALDPGRLVRHGAALAAGSAAATWPGCCDGSRPPRPNAIESPPTPGRPPRRRASRGCWSSRCRPARRCSPSWSSRDS